jgi:hypothetical protein
MSFDEALRLHAIGWQWFQTHAQQRMQIVSFWFVAMSFLSTGAVVAYANEQFGAAAMVAGAVVITSALFLLFDLRTRELISYGERLMAAAEASLAPLTSIPQVQIVGTMHTSNRKQVSYRTLFTALYGTAIVLGAIAVAFSLKRMYFS